MRATRPVRKSFPINAFVEERAVLVVGGGRVGLRKVELLLDAGAQVHLVCPVCVPELEQMVQNQTIVHQMRKFKQRDMHGMTLVFACTDDKHVNRHILEVAQRKRIPCCCADGNWADGDFVTPAIVRANDILISVSTSGRSCRQARMIKDNIGKHLDSIQSSDLLVIGTSHEHLGVEERGDYHLTARERVEVGKMLQQIWGLHEFFIFNTCNRIEVVAIVSQENNTAPLLQRILRFDQLADNQFYIKSGEEAFSHLCLVTAGMDSQFPGESHVIAQLKSAVEESVAQGWGGAIISELRDAALHVSRHIRDAVTPLLEVTELESQGVDYLVQHLGDLAGKRVMVIGSGVVGQSIVATLLQHGVGSITWVYYSNAPVLSEAGARLISVVQLDQISDTLPEIDAIVSAVDTREPVVRLVEHAGLLKSTRVVMVDLGMPRNIDPALGQVKQIHVADLDTLKNWYRKNTGALGQIRSICHQIIQDHSEFYQRVRSSIQGEP